MLAFRMLIKDLLVLFQAGNEGVCNILGELNSLTFYILDELKVRTLFRNVKTGRIGIFRHLQIFHQTD